MYWKKIHWYNNYIVQTRSNDDYGPIVFEELKEIVKKWVKFNIAFWTISVVYNGFVPYSALWAVEMGKLRGLGKLD